MAMIEAVCGAHKIKVSERSFENKFKKLGYRKIGVREKTRGEQREEYKEEQEIDVDTIPISDMNKEQLREYARLHGIDISGTKNPSEARRVIQAAIREDK